MGAGFATPMRELVRHKSYIIVHVGYCTDGMILKLWDEFRLGGGGRHLYVLLPASYARLFTTRLAFDINNGTKNVQLVLLGFFPRGLPLLQFYGSNLLRYGSMAVRYSW